MQASAVEADTDSCAQCHRSHTGVGDHLATPTYQNEQCLTCHDGTGSTQDIKSEFLAPKHHSLGGIDENSSKQCASCHESHIHVSDVISPIADPQDVRTAWQIVGQSDARYNNQSPPSGMYTWCQRCHVDAEQAFVGKLLLMAETTETSYVPYNVQVVSLTSYAQVDNNGETSDTAYWQYFSIDTIGDRYGYNDVQATGQSAHGRASMSASAQANIASWKGEYSPGNPALDCTTCHAQHGSDQPWMIVDTLAASEEDTPTTGYDMATAEGQKQFCEACHSGTYENCNLEEKCTNCHRHGRQF